MLKIKLYICFILLSLIVALLHEPIYAEENIWFQCKKKEECRVIIGAGGWPVALNRKHLNAYKQWLHEVRPFTEFYQIGDCFQTEEEIVSFVDLASQNFSCDKMKCVIMTHPVCTIEGASSVAPNI